MSKADRQLLRNYDRYENADPIDNLNEAISQDQSQLNQKSNQKKGSSLNRRDSSSESRDHLNINSIKQQCVMIKAVPKGFDIQNKRKARNPHTNKVFSAQIKTDPNRKNKGILLRLQEQLGKDLLGDEMIEHIRLMTDPKHQYSKVVPVEESVKEKVEEAEKEIEFQRQESVKKKLKDDKIKISFGSSQKELEI